MDPHQANLQPHLLLFNSRLGFNPTPIFLGVTFDCTLYFSKHVFSLKPKFFPHPKALGCISASSWGPSKAEVLSFTPRQISKVKFTPKIFFMFSLLQMPNVIGKSVNFSLTKFTPKAGQIHPQKVNLPPLENSCSKESLSLRKIGSPSQIWQELSCFCS